jgi:hypothetical protein
LELTSEERGRILRGDHTALKRKEEPQWSEGDHEVVRWSRFRRVVIDRDVGETADYPRQPIITVHFLEPIRHRDGTWRVPIRVDDRRLKTRFLGPQAPPPTGVPLTGETERGYRSTPVGAIDDAEAPDDDDLRQQKTEADHRWADFQEHMAQEERVRRQERSVREQLKQATRGLSPDAAMALLAAVERSIKRVLEEEGGE